MQTFDFFDLTLSLADNEPAKHDNKLSLTPHSGEEGGDSSGVLGCPIGEPSS